MHKYIIAVALAVASPIPVALAQGAAEAGRSVPPAVEQLRHAVGAWNVETDFIGPDGAIRATVPGRYEFDWVMPDRILSGWSELPTLEQKSAILFFHRPASGEIEMVSVGPDGQLWRMTGPEDSETRTTPNVTMADGSTLMLRFTRHSVAADSFGSTMEISDDGGETWRIGNQQRFVRVRKVQQHLVPTP